jgi:hypothetical protein
MTETQHPSQLEEALSLAAVFFLNESLKGVPGIRIGRSKRLNIFHVNRDGVEHRASQKADGRKVRGGIGQPQTAPPSEVAMGDVTGAAVVDLAPTGAGDLVEQLNEAGRRWYLRPLRRRRSVVVFYEVNDQAAVWFESLGESFKALAAAQRIWRVNTVGQLETTHQVKTHAGASALVSRSAVRAHFGGAPVITNVDLPTLSIGRQALHFLPDRVLVRDGQRFSDVAYDELHASFLPERFIEDGNVPLDSKQVDTTWRFVNVRGGPDLRFKDNRMLPVLLYGRVELASSGGLRWMLNVSAADAAERFVSALNGAPDVLGREAIAR